MSNLVSLVLKLPRNTEVTPEAAQTFLAALTQVNSVSFLQKLTGVYPQALALEIALINQQIKFQITCDAALAPFIETQIQSNYPLVIIEKSKDPLKGQNIEAESLILRKGSYYPIAIFSAFTDIDPMAFFFSVLSKSDPEQIALIQYALESNSSSWQR